MRTCARRKARTMKIVLHMLFSSVRRRLRLYCASGAEGAARPVSCTRWSPESFRRESGESAGRLAAIGHGKVERVEERREPVPRRERPCCQLQGPAIFSMTVLQVAELRSCNWDVFKNLGVIFAIAFSSGLRKTWATFPEIPENATFFIPAKMRKIRKNTGEANSVCAPDGRAARPC